MQFTRAKYFLSGFIIRLRVNPRHRLENCWQPLIQRTSMHSCHSQIQNLVLYVRSRLTHIHKSSIYNRHIKHISKYVKGLSAVCGAVNGLVYISGTNVRLECKAKHSKQSRLVGADDTENTSEIDFDWKQFGELLWLDIVSLSVAIFCALATALVNIRIPLVVGELVNVLSKFAKDNTGSFFEEISKPAMKLIGSYITQTIGCIGALWIISPKLTAIMCVVIPVIVGIGSTMGSGLRKLSKAAQHQVSKSTAVAEEALGNVRTVRAFAMEDKEHELFSQEVNESRNMNIRLGLGIGMFQGLANVALNGIVLGTLFVGGMFMSRQEISAGDLMSFLVATQTVERSLAQMSVLFGQVVRGLSAGSRVFEYINLNSEIPLKGGKKIPHHSLVGNVEFHDVCFSYPTRPEQQVLTDFSLNIPAFKTVALVGASGGGKSTVAALLERFYDVGNGRVTIDGVDIQALDPTWLRGHAIGFINQEPVLFATSVMENIRYGRPDATDTEVIDAAMQANAHDFIVEFPKGYNTVLGERGVTVSGGQKQRIAIARALIKNPSILVLDEATSALDSESERIVKEALDKVSKGRTVLVIAHRLSTIRDADIIAVVAKGRIVEMGDHQSLKRKKGLYWELIKQQEIEEEIQQFYFN